MKLSSHYTSYTFFYELCKKQIHAISLSTYHFHPFYLILKDIKMAYRIRENIEKNCELSAKIVYLQAFIHNEDSLYEETNNTHTIT